MLHETDVYSRHCACMRMAKVARSEDEAAEWREASRWWFQSLGPWSRGERRSIEQRARKHERVAAEIAAALGDPNTDDQENSNG